MRPRATPSALGAYNYEKTGGGIGGNARGSAFGKHLDLGVHFLGGSGVGRYGTSTLPDTTIRPDGTLALLKSYQALGTIEFHSNRWDIYGNAGGEYAGPRFLPERGGQAGRLRLAAVLECGMPGGDGACGDDRIPSRCRRPTATPTPAT